MVAATCRLCSAESCFSVICIVAPCRPCQPSKRTTRHKPAPNRRDGGGLTAAAEQCRSSRSHKRGPSRTTASDAMPSGACNMTMGDEIRIRRSIGSRSFGPIWLLMRSAAAIVLGIAAFFLSLQPARAAERVATLSRPGDARSGSLLLKNDDSYAEAPRLGIDIDLTVSGPTIRARVTQMFRNPTSDWVEAVYVYPLAEGGAVDTLKMVIGDRVVVGEIKERQAARIVYEQARQEGRKAALTEQERPNIFTNSVANIGPGETVLVQIEYQEPVRQSGGVFSLRVPLVVAPRYNPTPVVQTVDLSPGRQRLGRDRRSGAGPRPHLGAGARSRGERAGQSDDDHGAARRRLPARRGEEPSSCRQDRPVSMARRASSRCRRPGAGRSRLRADLEARGRESAVGRPVPRARRRCRLSARLRHAARDRPVGAEAAAARSHLRHRQFRLDGRHLDGAGQGQPHLCARPAAAGRPLQRDPLRQHDGHAVCRHRAGGQRASRPRQGVRRRARGARRHRDGAADAGGADRSPARRRRRISSARWSSSPTARSATSSSCSTPSRRCAGARACSWWASARRRTRS